MIENPYFRVFNGEPISVNEVRKTAPVVDPMDLLTTNEFVGQGSFLNKEGVIETDIFIAKKDYYNEQ